MCVKKRYARLLLVQFKILKKIQKEMDKEYLAMDHKGQIKDAKEFLEEKGDSKAGFGEEYWGE